MNEKKIKHDETVLVILLPLISFLQAAPVIFKFVNQLYLQAILLHFTSSWLSPGFNKEHLQTQKKKNIYKTDPNSRTPTVTLVKNSSMRMCSASRHNQYPWFSFFFLQETIY